LKGLLYIIFTSFLFLLIFSCEDDRYFNSPDAQLKFSTDTVMFDTIFTMMGSTTRHLKVRNPYNENILISKIRLAGGDLSCFKLNINGVPGNEAFNIEIPSRDSIYIFIEVTINPNGQNLPMVVKDSIEFTTNANLQDVDLIAWGQDFKLIKSKIIKTTTWTNEKPYLVYNYALVDSLSTLTIDPGVNVFFHKDAGLYVKGKLIANGTYQNPVSFKSDRLEESYKNLPDQWNGILLFSGSHGNSFNFSEIKNANIGLQVGTIEHEGFASVNLSNVKIENMTYAGVFALKSKINATNTLIANCGFYAAALLVGGEYEFIHSTIANFWGGYSRKPRTTSSVVISNVLIINESDGSKTTYVGPLAKANFGNCIIFGNNLNEIELGKSDKADFNYYFDHCILQVADTFKTTDKFHYRNIWKGNSYNPKFKSLDVKNFNYELDTLSPAKDIGLTDYSLLVPFDLKNKDRNADAGPDLGAYERIEKKK
jgi:hypothetical protein